MKVWKISYSNPNFIADRIAIVLATSAESAGKKLCAKLKIPSSRITNICQVDCNEVISR